MERCASKVAILRRDSFQRSKRMIRVDDLTEPAVATKVEVVRRIAYSVIRVSGESRGD